MANGTNLAAGCLGISPISAATTQTMGEQAAAKLGRTIMQRQTSITLRSAIDSEADAAYAAFSHCARQWSQAIHHIMSQDFTVRFIPGICDSSPECTCCLLTKVCWRPECTRHPAGIASPGRNNKRVHFAANLFMYPQYEVCVGGRGHSAEATAV